MASKTKLAAALVCLVGHRQAIRVHNLFTDDDVYAYSNLVADGLNINILDQAAKDEMAKENRKQGMKAIEDTSSILDYSQVLANNGKLGIQRGDNINKMDSISDQQQILESDQSQKQEEKQEKQWFENTGSTKLDYSKLTDQEKKEMHHAALKKA